MTGLMITSRSANTKTRAAGSAPDGGCPPPDVVSYLRLFDPTATQIYNRRSNPGASDVNKL